MEREAGSAEDWSAVITSARAARPELAFEDAAFIAFLHARPERASTASVERAAELLLAFGCARGDEDAVRAIDRDYLARLGRDLPARHHADAAEIIQIVRTRMLVPEPGAEPRIASYTGRGALHAWLRVAAVRVALNLERARRREVSLDETGELANRVGADLAMDDLKRRYRAEFTEAFEAALAALTAKDRLLLRQYYLDRVTMEAIGALHGVHRITIVRWMEAARAALGRETRRELGDRLRVDPNELASILRLIESQIDVSLGGLLERAP